MRLGNVIGHVTLSLRDPAYAGLRLVVLQHATPATVSAASAGNVSPGPLLVAVDQLGAGDGSMVGFTEGAEAAQPFGGTVPIDTYVACLVDEILYSPPEYA